MEEQVGRIVLYLCPLIPFLVYFLYLYLRTEGGIIDEFLYGDEEDE